MKFTISSLVMGLALSRWLFSFFPLHFDGHIRLQRLVKRVMTLFFIFFHPSISCISPGIDSLMIGHLLLAMIISTMFFSRFCLIHKFCFIQLFQFFFSFIKVVEFLWLMSEENWPPKIFYYFYYSMMMCDRQTVFV